MVSPISNSESTNFLTNIFYDFFFNWQTKKNWYKKFMKKLVKSSDEFVPKPKFIKLNEWMWKFALMGYWCVSKTCR